jgi:hypothetical protein
MGGKPFRRSPHHFVIQICRNAVLRSIQFFANNPTQQSLSVKRSKKCNEYIRPVTVYSTNRYERRCDGVALI